jgi:hypothetical protein
MTEVIKLDLLPDNTSDHYPLITQLVASLDIKETMKEKPGFTRTNWEKVDKDEYQQTLKAKLEKISFEQNHEHTDTQTLMDILIEAIQEVAPKRTKRKAKHMNIWNDEIAIALKNNKKALYEWKLNDKP